MWEGIPQSTLASNDFTRDWQNFVIATACMARRVCRIDVSRNSQGCARLVSSRLAVVTASALSQVLVFFRDGLIG